MGTTTTTTMRTFIASLAILSTAQGFAPAMTTGAQQRSSSQLSAMNEQSRANFLQTLTGTAAAAAFSAVAPVPAAYAEEGSTSTVKLPSGTTYDVIKTGDGPRPTVGELAAIRFRAEVKQTGNKIDDIFDTPEPYYTRVGSGGLLKVREEG